jgi:hypothetical protein
MQPKLQTETLWETSNMDGVCTFASIHRRGHDRPKLSLVRLMMISIVAALTRALHQEINDAEYCDREI